MNTLSFQKNQGGGLSPSAQSPRPLSLPNRLPLLLGALMIALSGAVGQAQLTVSDGLVIWLKADAGVTTNAQGQVSAWADQSPNGNNAAQRAGAAADELPLLVPNTVNGKPAIRFDGVNNVLEIANSPSVQPQSGDWTVFFIAKRLNNSKGDFPEVIGSRPWLTGTDKGWAVSYDANGLISSHLADGSTGHDVPGVKSISALARTGFQLWQVEENRAGGTTSFYLNGDLDVTLTPAMPSGVVDNTDPVYLGREIGGANNRRANMELAEVLVYNRVLTEAERQAVSTYLKDKFGFVPPTVSLTSPAGGASFAIPASFTISATAAAPNDSVQSVQFYANGALIATATALPYSAPIKVQSSGTITLTAVASDSRGLSSTSAPVAITVTGTVPTPPLTVNSGLALWLKADTGVTADESGFVSVWADQSPNGNDAFQDNAAATPPANFQPALVPNAVDEKPVLHFDGAQTFMQILNSASLQPKLGDWTVFFVAQRGSPSMGDFPQIIGSRPWNAGLDKGWAVSFENSSGRIGSHYSDGTAGHDVPAILSSSPLSTAAYQVWQVEENRALAFTRFYLLGRTNNTVKSTMPAATIDQANDVFIGSEVEGADNRRGNINLGEILIYDRALPDADRDAVTGYLLGKWAILQIFSDNQAPTITLSGLTNGTTLNAPASVTLTATAADSDGSIARVEFFRGAASLGVATSSPYTVTASISSLGNQTLTAVATDNLGTQTTSDPINIRVIAPNIRLISKIDYSDTFTTNAIRTDGLYNNNTNGAYGIEDSHGNAAASWTPINNFSFNTPNSSTDPAKLNAAEGNSGANSGFAQSGGGDFSITYGLQANYVVQMDAILPSDRLDITSLPTAGGGIFASNSLSVFLRRDTVTSLPGIGLFNGAKETGVTNSAGALVRTGISDNNWHNYALNFNQTDKLLQIYVDGVLLIALDLTRFADGLYQNYSNGAVGMGGAGGVFWMDNLKVGAAPKLIAEVDYNDTFTINSIRTDGLYNINDQGAYNVEDTHGNPEATWTPTSNFSFNTPGSSTDVPRLTAATGNIGADTGFAQSGGGDFSFAYGIRNDFVIQVDAILPTDRLDITSLGTPGGGIADADSLSVFLRRDSTAGAPHPAFPDTGLPGIGLYNGSKETGVFDAAGKFIYVGVDDQNWHRYAIHFDQPNNAVTVYVDNKLITTVDLTTFAGGIYLNYSNAAVGMGGGGGVFWMDNFVVGGPETLPPPAPVLTVSKQGNNVVISWTGTGTLQSAPAVTGPYQPVANATSPYSTAASVSQRFYRVSVP